MTFKGIKGKCWKLVKIYVRLREKDCYTCPAKNLEGQNAQAGHYRPVALVGANNYRAWDERFIHLQCGKCNGPGQGEQANYKAHLIADYGRDIVDEYDRQVASKAYAAIKNWQTIIDRYQTLIATYA